MGTQWILDARLENDTQFVCKLSLCQLRLMDDSRWPWLVLVPEITGAEEIFHLSPAAQQTLFAEIMQVSNLLEDLKSPLKINIGALGNIVRQLHIHVIGRNEGDANWPGPVWGFGQRTPYAAQAREKLIADLQRVLV